MPPARSAAPRRPVRAAARPARPAHRKPARRRSHLRVRWDRVGRISLLAVLAIVLGLYAQHVLAYLSAHSQASQQQAVVSRLERENASLAAQVKALGKPATIEADARALGMVRLGEHPYAVLGLPNR